MNTNNGKNGAGSNSSISLAPIAPTPEKILTSGNRTVKFDQPVILKQSPKWSRTILWALMGALASATVWAFIAKVEEAIQAQGKLEPVGAVKEVQVPVAGVVKAIYVQDGQRVKQGDRLLSLDSTSAIAQLVSLQKIHTSVIQESQFYQTQISGSTSPILVQQTAIALKLPPELIALTKSRITLVAENQLYRVQLNGKSVGTRLTLDQQERLRSNQAELNARTTAARLSVEQITKQLNQVQIRLATAKDTLATQQEILHKVEPLAKVGAIAQIQYLNQQQEVRTAQAEVEQLFQEQARLKLGISEAQVNVQNILAGDRKDLLTQIADNDKRIAEIDSQLTKVLVENNKRLAEVDSQIRQTQVNLQYQELRAPVTGTVFDLKAHSPGFVATSNEPILKIVPDDPLTAKVFISNRDIGFVKEGMPVDVRIDSFPFSEFGDIKGTLIQISSDALPPDEIRPYYSFPAKVRLERQSLMINQRVVSLQSGMSVSANLKLRERTVISIFTDLFSQNIESLKFVR